MNPKLAVFMPSKPVVFICAFWFWIAIVLAIVSGTLIGCATMVWNKPGGFTQDEFYRENGQCKAQALSVNDPYRVKSVYESCMEGKGWHLEQKQ